MESYSSKLESWKIFNQIALRYDLLNHILSFGMDLYWRRRLSLSLPKRNSLKVLDLATGTADQLIDILKVNHAKVDSAVGMDLSEGMLDVGRKKLITYTFSNRVELLTGDAGRIPAPDQSFDNISISFGIRNVPDVIQALKDMHRVLKSDGRLLILEFSLPTSKIFKPVYLFYLRHLLPRIGGWLSGDPKAYRYLNQTIEEFPSGDGFLTLMKEAGFTKVQAIPYTFGTVSLYIGEK